MNEKLRIIYFAGLVMQSKKQIERKLWRRKQRKEAITWLIKERQLEGNIQSDLERKRKRRRAKRKPVL